MVDVAFDEARSLGDLEAPAPTGPRAGIRATWHFEFKTDEAQRDDTT
jgi:hypothetical protein